MWQFNDEFLNKDFPRYFRQIAGRSLGDIMPLGEDRRKSGQLRRHAHVGSDPANGCGF
jgi:hypothetical protein